MHAQLSFSYVFMKFSNRIVIFFSLSIVTFGYFSFQSCSNLSGFIKKVKTEEISTVLIDNLQDSYQIHQWQKHWCSENEQLLNSSGMICKLHELDPWDPSLKKFFAQTSRNFHCLEVQPSLTYLDDQNFLHINESEYKLVVGNGSLVCEYQTFERLHDDKQLIFHERKILEKNLPAGISTDYVKVNCSKGDEVIYENLHPLVSNLTTNKTFSNETDKQLSVLIFMIDSTSLSMFRRRLPDLYRLLKKDFGAFIMRGFNKVADNTFVNMIPMLCGKRVFRADMGMPTDFKSNPTLQPFDDLPIIWKNFSELGYVTYFDEDRADINFFTLNMKGFKRKPVDHYYRPFWLAVDKNMRNLTHKSTHHCFGNQPLLQSQLDILHRLQLQYPGKLKFSLTFSNDLTHESEDALSKADITLTEFFAKIRQFLNHSVLIVAADHGHRFSSMRSTLIGLLEERLPFLAIRFPPWFLKNHKKIAESLNINQRRLSSHFDLHATLSDILNSNFRGDQKPCGARGLSLLYEIPKNRSCPIAGIPQHFCTCSEYKNVDFNETTVRSAAEYLVKRINHFLRNYRQICFKLFLPTIIRAEVFSSNDKLIRGHRTLNDKTANKTYERHNNLKILRLLVSVKPSDGKFEGLVQHNSLNDKYSLIGGAEEISRIDKYGNQSKCIDQFTLRKFCYCR